VPLKDDMVAALPSLAAVGTMSWALSFNGTPSLSKTLPSMFGSFLQSHHMQHEQQLVCLLRPASVAALTLLAFCYFAAPSAKLQVMQIALVAPECA